MSVNDITGDRIVTDIPSDKYKAGWETIFGRGLKPVEVGDDNLDEDLSIRIESFLETPKGKEFVESFRQSGSFGISAGFGDVDDDALVEIIVNRDSVPEDRPPKFNGYAS